MAHTDVLLIGTDGGATEAKAHAVACDSLEQPSSYALRPEAGSRKYAALDGFAPLPVAEQIAQRDNNAVRLSEQEKQQGALWVAAAGEAILEVAQSCGARRLLVGVGMPGLKTPDGRGICALNNGPRIPDYLNQLERQLAQAGCELISPIAALGSDADYCGLGEQYAAEGLFGDVDNAYYVGGGTGLADAMKLRGRLVPFDAAKTWIQKSWQMPSALGPTFEKLVSAKSLNRIYADLLPTAGTDKPASTFPEVHATVGQAAAGNWLSAVALIMAELIFERIYTIRHGRAEVRHRGGSYASLDANHEYRGLLLDRVVIGQRVGQIYGDPVHQPAFGRKLDACLAALVLASGDAEMAERYLVPEDHQLAPGLVRSSKLRAAPALGAAIAALRVLNDA